MTKKPTPARLTSTGRVILCTVARPCLVCNASFRSSSAKRKCCSSACAHIATGKARSTRGYPRACVVCGTAFKPNRQTARFCSKRCAGIASAALRQKAIKQHASKARP